MTLDQLKLGQQARIVGIDADEALRRKLLSAEISQGAVVKFLRKAPLGTPVQYQVNDNMIALRSNVARLLQVQLLEGEQELAG